MKHLLPVFLVTSICLSFGLGCTKQNVTRDGIIRKYHKNGEMLSETTYKNGKKHGRARTWFDNGKLHSESYFNNDSIVGHSISYYRNGNKNYEHRWSVRQKLDGLSRFWHENGVLGDSGWYEDGKFKGEWKRFYQSGQLKIRRNYANGLLHGQAVYFNKKGDTIRIEEYDSGTLINAKDY